LEPLTPERVAERLLAQQVRVGREAAAALARFLELLGRWNRVHNLTGIRDPTELIDRHLVESLALAPFVQGPRACDVGSGGGLPGLPLAIVLPQVDFTLIESRRKRASFLRQAKATLGLGNVEIVHARAEDAALVPFDTVLARAVAPPAELMAIVGPLVAPGGRLVLPTGEDQRRTIVSLATGFTALAGPPPASGSRGRIVVLDRARVSASPDLR
jgi:16S rRNA (guanine527-N7)-methyltransferase